MKRYIPLAAIAAALVCSPPASAAGLLTLPVKPCYRSGENVQLVGFGFRPWRIAEVKDAGVTIQWALINHRGNFSQPLRFLQPSGEQVRQLAAVDDASPPNAASIPLRLSAVEIDIRPRRARPGRRVRISARGFTTGSRLYAHLVRGHSRRTIGIGRLRGPCHTLRRRARLIPRRTHPGSYTVQFDTSRRYSSRTPVSVRFSVFVFRRFG